ncbi:MAG: S9 family peptidase, partial [Anaerolineales bacterium]|nr:S9 family peptidase [Anaerolineales bacterium]
SRQIAFLSQRGERTQIYRLDLAGGDAEALTDLPQGVMGAPVWSADGGQIAFSTIPERAERKPETPYRVTRHVYRFDAIGYLDPLIQDLFILNLTDGAVRQLTADATMNVNPQWSPDGREILYNASMQPDNHRGHYPQVRIIDLEGNSRAVFTEAWGYTQGSAAWHPDGQQVLFAGTPQGSPIGTKADLYLISADGKGKPQNRTATLPYGIGGGLQGDQPAGITRLLPVISPLSDGSAAFVRVQQGGEVQIYRIELSGPEEWAPVISGERCNYLLGLSADNRSLLFVSSSFNQPTDLYLADSEGGNEQQLTALNDDFLAGLAQARVEQMLFPGVDGVGVEGWTIMPDTGAGPFPAVLYIHGGPHGAFGHVYHFDTQMLVGAGYAVIMVNHRASTGYGNGFSTAIKGDWGNLDYQDLMSGVDEAIRQGWVDADRIGICGLSGGGNLSTWTVGQTNRFKAAVPENPVTNWVSFYGVSDIGPWFAVEQLGGRPHEIPDIYRRCSPITYAHRCQTPTLLIQGESDYRCPAEQSEQFYAVLKDNDCPVEMVRLPGSFHADSIVGAPRLRRAQNDALLDWMNRYVLGLPADKEII